MIEIVPAERGTRFECFDCGLEIVASFSLTTCPSCGEGDNFHRMN